MKHLRFLLLAALVAMPLTACDEDKEGKQVVEPTPVGTITGTVSAEGTGLSGVAVTLVGATSQSATTGSGGTYTFTNVEAGSYGVSIDASTHPDVSFSQTSKTTTITTNGETVTVDFTGSYIRTAAITGVVSASGAPLAGVSVAVTGGPDNVSKAAVTNAGGEFSVTGLRAGTYTVTISNLPAGVNFTTTTQQVTVGTGESKTAHFAGTAVELATISGAVTIDNVGVAGIPVALTGGATANTETGPGGAFSFTNLTPGSYTVTITPPADATFAVVSKNVTVNAGETGVVNFAGQGPKEPATISIGDITYNPGGGSVPVVLTNVFGQIEVGLNIARGDLPLDHVDVLIDDVVVATQTFTQAAPGQEAAVGENEVVVLSVPTTQVRKVGDYYVPVIFNGAATISANLYEAGAAAPIPSNEVPVVMNNPDVLLQGSWTIAPDTPDPSVVVGANTWYTGGVTMTGQQYLAFSTMPPTSVAWADAGSAGCTVTGSLAGTFDTGLVITDQYNCAGTEGTVVPNLMAAPAFTPFPAPAGPDGSAVTYPTMGFSSLGAQFQLAGEDRWFLIPPAFPTTNPSATYVDNLGPTVEVDGQVPATLPGVSARKVAFQDDFDQWWVNASYAFLQDVNTADGGVGVDVASIVTMALPAGVAGPCTSNGTVVVTGDDLDETVVSDGTPDGYQLCATAADLLGNTGGSDVSNWFGVDKVAPSVRLHGTTGALPAIVGTVPAVNPVPNTQIYNIGAPYTATDTWGLEAQDERSGFDQGGLVAGFPAMQSMTATDVGGVVSCVGAADDLSLVLSDNWVRTGTELPFTCGLKEPAYYAYSGYVTDRAGNQSSTISFNWMIDQAAAASISSVGFATTFYNAGQDATFWIFGADDLEVIEAQLGLSYPVAPDLNGDTDLTNDFFMVVHDETVGTRWDGLPPNFDADLFTTAVTGVQVTIPAVPGRIDFTCSGAGAPYASCVNAHELTPTATEFNSETGGLDSGMLPASVTAVSFTDAGMNPYTGAPVSAAFLPAQWQTATSQPWSTADIITWQAMFSGSNTVAEHKASTSITEPYFDKVLLVHNDGASPTATITICGEFPAPVLTDNGFNRFWTYTIATPAAGSKCDPATGTLHAIGVKGDAMLVTQPAV